VVKRLKWLKDFDMPCAVIVDPVHPYSEGQQTRDPVPTIEALLPPHPTTLCGRRIRKLSSRGNSGPFCTLGGLVLVEGLAFGMTVEHTFEGGFETSGSQGAHEDQIGPGDDLLSGEADLESPFISFDDENDGDTFENSFRSLHESTGQSYVEDIDRGYDPVANQHQENLEGVVYRRIGKVLPPIRKDEVTVRHSNDWALVKIDEPSYFLPNELKLPTQDASMIIGDMVRNIFKAKATYTLSSHVAGFVLVGFCQALCRSRSETHLWIRGSSSWTVNLVSSPASHPKTTFVLMGCHFTAHGDSGAWVVHDGKLCGHIVGGKEHLTWAYMVPIHQIMREIKQAFGTDNICLPKNVNEYPTRARRQEPSLEANIDTYDNEKVLATSLLRGPSIQRTDDLSEKATDSGALSTQIHLQAPSYPALRLSVNSYRTILSKARERKKTISHSSPYKSTHNCARKRLSG
jgi:hypothetical protein